MSYPPIVGGRIVWQAHTAQRYLFFTSVIPTDTYYSDDP